MSDKTPLSVRIAAPIRKALEKAAKDDHRTVTSYLEHLLDEHLQAKGYLLRRKK